MILNNLILKQKTNDTIESKIVLENFKYGDELIEYIVLVEQEQLQLALFFVI